MNQPYDDQRLASVYHEGNDMPDSLLRAWSEFVLGFAAVRSPRTLDVGSGTGAFSAGLARAGASSVLGIEPSEAMLSEAPRAMCATPVEARLRFRWPMTR